MSGRTYHDTQRQQDKAHQWLGRMHHQEQPLTINPFSPIPRFGQAIHPSHPRGPGPETKVPFQQRIVWTAVTLVIFLVMSQMPLYGIVSSGEQCNYQQQEDWTID